MDFFPRYLPFVAPVPGEFPTQRPVTRSFDVFFDLHPNKRLSKQWWGWCFETPSCPLWLHRSGCTYVSREIYTRLSLRRDLLWLVWVNFAAIFNATLTLSQWSSSGNPVAIQCAWHLDPSVHWNATGERILVASVLPVVFQWLSSGLPVCSNYAN